MKASDLRAETEENGLTSKHNVYEGSKGRFYSNGVTRPFGENKLIQFNDGSQLFSAVDQLLKTEDEAYKHGMTKVGFITSED